ncbi:hypothetical protein [Thiomicrorhabdus sp. 6S3-12]|uniref:hypothetical protein n=1 Tax=Thiomicrorhabdus sp. 6S3-12 TaxID=2819681 RepID=UPI001AADE757|nr:hypothetical protein [Thiomicrorhabdus sp. 6S3-12]MBO1925009.1 hypothetical protein [Thiomicrorhabdus sp. 6S3-12]
MKRREFMTLAGRLAAATSLPVSLVGCGGGSDSTAVNLSSIDARVATTNDQLTDVSAVNNDLQVENSQIIASSSPASAATARSTTVSSSIADFFHSRSPNDFLPYNHYLSDPDSDNIWQDLIHSQQQAYDDFEHQLAKLMATFRLYDYKNPYASTDAVSPIGITQAQARGAAQSELTDEEQELFSAVDRILDNIQDYIASYGLKWVVDFITPVLKALYEIIVSADVLKQLVIQFLAQLFLERFLEAVTENALQDLNFDSKGQTMLSFAKMSVAAISVLALDRIDYLSADNSQEAVNYMTTYLTAGNLIARLLITWLELSQAMVTTTVSTATAEIRTAIDADEGSQVGGNEALGTELRTNAAILAITGFTIKQLLSTFIDIDNKQTVSAEFAEDGTALPFSFLFQSPITLADQAISRFSYNNIDLQTNLQSILSRFVDQTYASENVDEETDLQAEVDAIAALHINTRTSLSEQIIAETASIETDAYNFALELAQLAFEFTSNTEEDAYLFASQMAEYAYNFTMDIEEDAYNFAMQGMEYGYLFASRGEEVGIMADRILWMAVQIGVMADRIGEMADRIVYTEQLIVYTEMLILDFGVLIYGVIKQITNLILSGMALILDRDWYTPDSEDLILSTIDKNVTAMLENMQAYSLAVLENQRALREITQDAIDTIPELSA